MNYAQPLLQAQQRGMEMDQQAYANQRQAALDERQARMDDLKYNAAYMALDKVRKDAEYQAGLGEYLKNARPEQTPQQLAAYTPQALQYDQLPQGARAFMQAEAGPSSAMVQGQQQLAQANAPTPPVNYQDRMQAYAMQQGNVPEFIRIEAENKAADAKTMNDLHGLVAKIKERGLKPETAKPMIDAMAATIINPKLRELYSDLNIMPDWSSKTTIALDGTEGFKHPVTGLPLAAGVYDLEFDANRQLTGANYSKENKESIAGLNNQNRLDVAELKGMIRGAAASGGGRGGSGGGKPPAGYRYTPDGNLEAIPGGPADQKQETAAQAKENNVATLNSTIATVDRLLSHPGLKAATGLSSKLDPRNYVPGTDASDFQRELESFDSQLFLANVTKMKGMGALSENEGKKISAAAGAIKPGMSEESFKRNMKIIRDELENAKARARGGNTGASRPQPPAGRKSTADPMGIL